MHAFQHGMVFDIVYATKKLKHGINDSEKNLTRSYIGSPQIDLYKAHAESRLQRQASSEACCEASGYEEN